MISLYDKASIDAARAQPLDPSLRTHLARHLKLAETEGLAELTFILVIQPGDTEEALKAEIGFSPLASPLDGARFGTAHFQPYWAYLREADGWHEMIVTVGDSGFAFILLISNEAGVIPELLNLCQRYGAGE